MRTDLTDAVKWCGKHLVGRSAFGYDGVEFLYGDFGQDLAIAVKDSVVSILIRRLSDYTMDTIS
ncbi:hypothetical protein T265_12408 [Opisthorchis viverrini]|uniref:Uncharacterized protein n=1 Tax=Opisthorchis viverrini TaxID=6198 RepID=A0A074YXR9_OPIVI|nr:hypothetical protein T265_12408 [Opisthorchis viverrini]KER17987.1 hypothetical protein T265_12408 [Opisthorchis viverrini]